MDRGPRRDLRGDLGYSSVYAVAGLFADSNAEESREGDSRVTVTSTHPVYANMEVGADAAGSR